MRGWRMASGEWLVAVRIVLVMLVLMVLALPLAVFAIEGASATITAAPEPVDPMAALLGAALALSELLALIPSLKSNGILHGIILVMKKLAGRPMVSVVALVVLVGLMAGCGKGLHQVTKAVCDVVRVPAKAYDDTVENIEAVKEAVSPSAPAPPARGVTQ